MIKKLINADGADKNKEPKSMGSPIPKNDVPAPPAITTVRPPTRNEFFAAKAAAAIPSVTGLGVHPYLIYKLHSGKVAEMGSQVDGNLLSATK